VSDVDVDVLVVGGGPVGVAASIVAAGAGLRTAVIERRPDPVDKACGEGLMPSAVHALARIGVDPPGVPFAGIRYVSASGDVTAAARFRGGPGRGVRRTRLHDCLTARAVAAGVTRVTGQVTTVRLEPDRVVAGGLSAGWLLAADGLHSTVRRQLGLDRPPRVRPRFGLRAHFAVQPWTDLVEVHWTDGAEAYVTPVGDNEVGVAVLTHVRGVPYHEWLTRFPALAVRLGRSPQIAGVLGAGPLEQNVAARTRGRVLLVGDASGYVDALTGEGVALGLAQAGAAVRCILAGRPDRYDRAWATTTRRYRVLTRTLLYAAEREPLRRAVVPAAAALPPVFRAAVRALA
jgi:flavin-dependent dehydrogenase